MDRNSRRAGQRRPPAASLSLARRDPAREDASADPLQAANEQARAAFGLDFWFAGDPLAALDLDTVSAADLEADLAFLFPSEEDLAVLRSVKPDYRLPPLEERTRRFLSDFLLCSAFLEYEERSRRICGAAGISAPPLGNLPFWRSRCRAVVALISALPPCREKSLLSLRYLNGHSVEACAPLLGVSRRTAYRIHKKALALASRVLLRKKG